MSMNFSKHPHDRILICNFYLYLDTPETLPSRSSQAKPGSQYFYLYLATLLVPYSKYLPWQSLVYFDHLHNYDP